MRQELEQLLDTHRAQRPEMQPQDYYKLLYQREFGCGHTAPAPETAGPPGSPAQTPCRSM